MRDDSRKEEYKYIKDERFEYDETTDLGYIHVNKDLKWAQTISLNYGCELIIDLDIDGKIIGIEII